MTDTIELTEESTTEDIAAAVDQIASEVEEEQKGEQKPDAQITSEHSDNEKKTPESEKRTVSSLDDSEEDEDSGEPEPDWREKAHAEASAYGISEEDVADFQSREEWERAVKLFDRQMDAEREKLKSGEEDKGGKDSKVAEPPKEVATEAKPGSYSVKLDPDVYDDELVAEFNSMREHYESRIEALESRFADADAQAAEERFDRSVDSLEFSQLFGKSGEESSDELERRQNLYDHVLVEMQVMERLGRKINQDALVERVARSLFPEEYEKRIIKNHTRKISRQSNSRQGGGVTRPTDPPEDPRDAADKLYREMEGV